MSLLIKVGILKKKTPIIITTPPTTPVTVPEWTEIWTNLNNWNITSGEPTTVNITGYVSNPLSQVLDGDRMERAFTSGRRIIEFNTHTNIGVLGSEWGIAGDGNITVGSTGVFYNGVKLFNRPSGLVVGGFTVLQGTIKYDRLTGLVTGTPAGAGSSPSFNLIPAGLDFDKYFINGVEGTPGFPGRFDFTKVSLSAV